MKESSWSLSARIALRRSLNAALGGRASMLLWEEEPQCCSGRRSLNAALGGGASMLLWGEEPQCCSGRRSLNAALEGGASMLLWGFDQFYGLCIE
jgi:hypothetical protein